MINSNLQQMVLYQEYECSKEKVISLLLKRKDILKVAKDAICIGFQRFYEEAKNKPLLFSEKNAKPTMLNAYIKTAFNESSAKLEGVVRHSKDGSTYYKVDGLYYLFIKKLDKSGMPSYVETQAARERMSTLPCAFIGPRIDSNYYNFGGAYVSVTSSRDSVMWYDAINNLLPEGEIFSINENKITSLDDIITIKEEKIIERSLRKVSNE